MDFESVIKSVAAKLDQDTVVKLIKISTHQVFPPDIVPSGTDYLCKLQEDGWFSPTNVQPLIELLNDINRSDIIETTKLMALSTGKCTCSSII